MFGPTIRILPDGKDPLDPPGSKRRPRWAKLVAALGLLGPIVACGVILMAWRPLSVALGADASETPEPPPPGATLVTRTFSPELLTEQATALTPMVHTVTPAVDYAASITAAFDYLFTPTLTGTPSITDTPTPTPPAWYGSGGVYYSPGPQPDPILALSPSPTVDMSFSNLIGLFPTPTQFPASMQTLMAILPTYTPYPTYTPLPTFTRPPPTALPPQSTYTPFPTWTPMVPSLTPWIVYVTVEVPVTVVVTATPTDTPEPTATPEA